MQVVFWGLVFHPLFEFFYPVNQLFLFRQKGFLRWFSKSQPLLETLDMDFLTVFFICQIQKRTLMGLADIIHPICLIIELLFLIC